MKTADLITSYLSNEMSPEQERQFLLSVAASDSLRLALKSHVMLDKIVTNQIQHAHVPEAVRSAIFTQMNASIVGAAPFGGAAAAAESGASDSMSLLGRLFNGAGGRFGKGALVAILLIGGYAAGYLTHSELAAPVTVSAPAAPATGKPVAGNPAPATVPQATAPAGTVQPANGAPAQNGTLADATPKESPVRLRTAAAEHQVSTRESFTRAHEPVSAAKHPQTAAETPVKQADKPANVSTPAESEGGKGTTDTISRSGTSTATVDLKGLKHTPKPIDKKEGAP